MSRERGASEKQYTDREAEQLRMFFRKCFLGMYQFLQLSHGNLFILVRGLSLRGLRLPWGSGSALARGYTGVGNLRYPGLWL